MAIPLAKIAFYKTETGFKAEYVDFLSDLYMTFEEKYFKDVYKKSQSFHRLIQNIQKTY